jgi:hypothetical protein
MKGRWNKRRRMKGRWNKRRRKREDGIGREG